MSKEVENFIDQAATNIVEDRAATKTLLMNLMKYMQSSDDRHREVGLVAAKYLETLQRSNEQLVKIIGLKSKNQEQLEMGFSDGITYGGDLESGFSYSLGDLDFLGTPEEDMREKYPALKQAWEHYQSVLEVCKTKEKEDED